MTRPALVEREHRLQRLALEGQLAVGVVLEDPEAVLGGELDQPRPLRARERAAGRVVGVGDDVGELDRPLGERRLEGAEVEPVGLQRHRHQLDPEPLQEQQRAVVGRLLDDHPVAGPEQMLEQHRPAPPASRWRPSPARRRARRAARRSTRRAPDARSRSRRRAPFPSRSASARAAASRTASCGRMSALGAPRANEIVSPAIAPTLATPSRSADAPPNQPSGGRTRGVSELKGRIWTGKLRHAQAGEAIGSRRDGSGRWRGWRPGSTASSRGASCSRSASERRRSSCGWTPAGSIAVHREVYAVGHTRIEQHGYRWAAVLAYGDGALLSHRSAAALWGSPTRHEPDVDVTRSAGRQGLRRREGIWIHRGRCIPEDRDERARDPGHLGRPHALRPRRSRRASQRLEHAWEEADRLKLLQLGEIERVCERGYGRRALKPIRRLLAEARAAAGPARRWRTASSASAATTTCRRASTNVTVLDREVDVLWPAARLIVELDSWEFHSHRAAFERDRARDTRLLVAGYRTIRVTHDRLDDEAATLAARDPRAPARGRSRARATYKEERQRTRS